jgi:hypothetical protein
MNRILRRKQHVATGSGATDPTRATI